MIGSCLSAPAEVSAWTRFCEVELPRAVNALAKEKKKRATDEINGSTGRRYVTLAAQRKVRARSHYVTQSQDVVALR